MIFDRVICGVDGGDESLEAVRQGARLVVAGGRLLIVAVAELEVAAAAGWAATTVAEELQQEARDALERAHAEVANLRLAETRLLDGPVPGALLQEIESERATLVCIGMHAHSRGSGILLARASTTLLHDAPCAVLVARPPADAGSFPSSIAVGIDGSPASAVADAVATSLQERFGAATHRVLATGGKHVDAAAVAAAYPGVEPVDGKPVDALVAASDDVDLIVVGSRGAHGLRALGSVSERVAHQARCSVLVARQL